MIFCRTNAAYSPAHMTQVPVVPGASDTMAVFAEMEAVW
jgi:hypothetical protein